MKFNENQIKAIEHYEGNCCVLASAGSGKTSVLTNRIVNLIQKYNVNPKNILAITFSNKAKENMKIKINNIITDIGNNVTIETFHAFGNKLLKESRYNYYFKTLMTWQQKQIINNIVIKILYLEDNDNDVKTNNILQFISFQKNNLIDCNNSLIPIKDMPYGINIMKEIYQKYEQQKSNEKSIDFDDMLINTYKLLSTKHNELEKYQNRYKFILVDEFQDTNKAMYEILRLIGKKYNNVFVVGDALQNIYEWNCADNNYLINFYKDWIDTTIIPLNINYRSSNDIVELSNKLVLNTKETTHKYYYKSISNKPKNKTPSFTCYIDEEDEANNVAKLILDYKKNDSLFSDIVILTRTNFMIQAIEYGLFNNNVPYEIIGGKSFYELKEIKNMISYLKLVNDVNDDEAFIDIYNSPNRYLGNVFFNEVAEYAKRNNKSLFASMKYFPRSNEWRYKKGIDEIINTINKIKSRKRYKVGDLIEIIRNELNYDKYILKEDYENNNKNEKIENLDTLVSIANKFNNIEKFLEEVNVINEFSKSKENSDKVKVMTIHKSKGLEFPIVFIIGVNDMILPHAKSNNENEERRLFYVALTRAENELHISSTQLYNDKIMNISPFIYDIFDNVD